MPKTEIASAPAEALVIQAPDIETPRIKQLARVVAADTIEALTAAQTQAFRLSPARSRAGVPDFCAEAGIDFGFVPGAQSWIGCVCW